jgi:S1-C subfamily serine protease
MLSNRQKALTPAVLALLSCSAVVGAQAESDTTKSAHSAHKAPPAKSEHAGQLTAEEEINIRVYKQCNRAVVNLASVTSAEDLLLNNIPKEGFGSGFFIRPDGYILTNYHVVEGTDHLQVTLWNNTTVHGKVVGVDPQTDLAVVKIEPPKGTAITTIPFGDSSTLEVGRRVLAIGNPFALDRTLTQGIVSMLGRTMKLETGRSIKGVIQTDAAINPGNSGGPLLDTHGCVIGINTAIKTLSGQSAGIGFALPINIAKNIIPQLIEHHRVLRCDLGIDVVSAGEVGLRIRAITKGSPAAIAGLCGPKLVIYQLSGIEWQQLDLGFADIILAVDNIQVNSVDALMSYIESKKPNQVVTLTIVRSGRLLKIPVKLTVNAD